MYNTKNYTEQGGEKTHIGGELVVESGGEIVVKSGGKLKFGSTEFKQAAAVADAAGSAPTAAEFKALLDALQAAGLMATS